MTCLCPEKADMLVFLLRRTAEGSENDLAVNIKLICYLFSVKFGFLSITKAVEHCRIYKIKVTFCAICLVFSF